MATTNTLPFGLPYYQYVYDGKPLFNGKIYAGVENTDPTNPANQVDILAVQSDGSTVVQNQPVRTNSNGYAIDGSGNVAYLKVESKYSIAVYTANDVLVHEEECIDPLDGEGTVTPVSDVAYIKTYIDAGQTTDEAILSAVRAGRIVDFSGLTLTFNDNFTMPVDAICNEWRWNGATTTFTTGICDLGTRDMHLNIGTGKVSEGLKKAKVTVNSTASGNTFTVDDPSQFSEGDMVSCSWSLYYLPNSTDRIGGANPLSEFNYITDITGNVITVEYNVPEVIPANAFLLNSRFDKGGLIYSGTGTLRITGGEFTDTSAGYFLAMTDSARSSTLIVEGTKFTVSGLDQIFLSCKKAIFRDCFFGARLDIAKQCFVNNTAPSDEGGLLACYNCDFKGENRDTLMYTTIIGWQSGGEIGDAYFENCNIDGTNPYTYTGSAEDFQSQDMLHLWSSGGAGMPAFGHMTIKGGSITNVDRIVFGTTYVQKLKWKFKSFTMENVIPCEADPIYIDVSDYSTSEFGYCTFNNCYFSRCGRATLNSGFPITDIGKVVYNNCTLKPSDHLGDSDITIARSYMNNCRLEVGDNGEFFDVVGNSNQLNNVVLPRDSSTGTGALRFQSMSETLADYYTLILDDYDLSETSPFTLTDWFACVDSSSPNIQFGFEGCPIKFFYGDDPSGSSVRYTMQYTASAPNQRLKDFRGLFAAVATTSSTVKYITSQAQVSAVDDIFSTTGTGSAGSNSLTVTSNPAGAIVTGTLLMIPDTSGINVYCYRVTNVSSLTLTLDRNLVVAVASGNVRGFNVV